MRLLTLRVRHFKGIEDQSVSFRPTGVTIIQGPNEAGKTSLMAALDILLRFPDSSQHHEVEATKPAGVDAPTEIEASFRLGGRDIHYIKRFHRQPSTTLTIEGAGPREVFTGRQAHDQMDQLLDRETDRALWAALKLDQGLGADALLGGSRLGDSPSLRQALDRAAGGSGATDDSLYERVKRERDRYYTEGGREAVKVFQAPRQAVSDAEARVEAARNALLRAERDAEREQELTRLVAELRQESARVTTDLKTLAADLGQLGEAEEALRRALEALTAAQREAAAWEERGARRERLGADAARLRHACEQATAERQREAEDRNAAEAAATDARAAREAAEALAEGARSHYERLQEDVGALRKREEVRALTDRLQHLYALTALAAECREKAERVAVTDDRLAALRKQRDKLRQAEAGLEVGQPSLTIVALRPIQIEQDGVEDSLESGASRDWPVPEPLSLTVSDQLRVAVRPGSSVHELGAKVTKERAALDRLLQENRVASVALAEDALIQKREWLRQADDADRDAVQWRAAEGEPELSRRAATLTAELAAYEAARGPTYDVPRELRAAEADAQAAYEVMQEEAGRAEEARTRAIQAEGQLTQAEKAVARAEAARLGAAEALKVTEERLQSDQAEWTDEELGERRAQAAALVRALEDALAQARSAVDRMDPAQLRAREAVLRERVERLQQEAAAGEAERAECRGRLSAIGGEGLEERLQDAEGALADATGVLAALERRAGAAKRLYETLAACRDAQQRAYRRPLQERIEELGRIVFGQGFRVDLDDNLAVTVRELHGTTLPLDQLSTGAKEQMALLVRLAAASLVAPGEGVPVLLDDTLGHTDDKRLDLMAHVLNHVAEHCQIIVLTSAPIRYTRLRNPLVIDLAARGTAREEAEA